MASRKSDLMRDTARRVHTLIESQDRSEGRAALAHLRRGIGHAPGELPELWGSFLAGLPESMQGKNGKPSKEEWAIYLALTMFALHQQSKDAPVHSEGVSLGTAAAELMDSHDDLERVWKRLMLVAGADNIDGLAYHLRGIIQLLRNTDAKLDYAMLAGDLFEFQSPMTIGQVRLRWGQDFFIAADRHFATKDVDNKEENSNEE